MKPKRGHRCLYKGCRRPSNYLGCQMCATKITVSLTYSYSVLLGIPCTPGCQLESPQAVKMEMQENSGICDSNAKQPCTVTRRSKPRTGQSWHGQQCYQEAHWQLMAVLKSTLAKQWDNSGGMTWCNIMKYHERCQCFEQYLRNIIVNICNIVR